MLFDLRNILLKISIVICVSCAFGKLPTAIVKCRASDKQCILKSINNVISNHFTGNKEFGLAQLEPLVVGDISTKDNPKNPVNLNVNFFNMVLHGLKNIRADRVKGFGKTPDGRHDMLLHGPVINILGSYKVNGNILLLPVTGDGNCNITMSNFKIKLSIEGASETKNDQLYMNCKSSDFDIAIERLYLHFDNLFNGDQVLGDNINKLINDNWAEFFEDFKGPIIKKINEKFIEICKQMFSTTPYTELVDTS